MKDEELVRAGVCTFYTPKQNPNVLQHPEEASEGGNCCKSGEVSPRAARSPEPGGAEELESGGESAGRHQAALFVRPDSRQQRPEREELVGATVTAAVRPAAVTPVREEKTGNFKEDLHFLI